MKKDQVRDYWYGNKFETTQDRLSYPKLHCERRYSGTTDKLHHSRQLEPTVTSLAVQLRIRQTDPRRPNFVPSILGSLEEA